MIQQIGFHQESVNPFIELKIYHITEDRKMFFGEWKAPSGKFEEAILNPAFGEQNVLDVLQVGTVVHVRTPKENTKSGGTPWRAYMRPLNEQPIWVQEATKPEEQKLPSVVQIRRAVTEPVSADPLRVTINESFLAQHCREVAQKKGYTGNTAASKAVMDIIRAAMKAGIEA